MVINVRSRPETTRFGLKDRPDRPGPATLRAPDRVGSATPPGKADQESTLRWTPDRREAIRTPTNRVVSDNA